MMLRSDGKRICAAPKGTCLVSKLIDANIRNTCALIPQAMRDNIMVDTAAIVGSWERALALGLTSKFGAAFPVS
jgi:hypothetical protein